VKILALNLCTSMAGHPRRERMAAVADFVKSQQIDILLVQEGVRSCLIYNTIRQLAKTLGYDYFAKTSWGFPFFFESMTAVISRFPIIHSTSLSCEVPQTEWLDALPIPWRARAVAATVEAPVMGITTLVSVHLTSSPKTEADRQAQFDKFPRWFLGMAPVDVRVVGGDFNTGQNNSAFKGVFGIDNITGQSPDYITVAGARVLKGYPVLAGQNVTDHRGGVVAEVEQ
jgi:endonuclease/exonuclease/phosphatase family metal-dependent hydrolase